MKLHLPKVLLTAVIAVSACSMHAQAVDYSVYNGSSIDIYQWTGTSDKTSICYGLWYKATYDSDTQGLVKANTATGTSNSSSGFTNIVNASKYIMFDDKSTANAQGRAQFDANPVTFAGIIVKENSAVSTLAGSLSSTDSTRNITLGTADSTAEAPTYSVIAKDFTLTNADSASVSTFTLQGHQQWEVANDVTFTLATVQGKNIVNTGTLTVTGEGEVCLGSSLNNSGTVTFGTALRFDSDAVTKQVLDGTLSNNTHGFRTGQTLLTLVSGTGKISYGDNFALYMDDSTTAVSKDALVQGENTLTYTTLATGSIYEITSAYTEVVNYGGEAAATAGATGFLMEGGTKLAITGSTAGLTDGITVTGAGATISLSNKASLNTTNSVKLSEGGSVNYVLDGSSLDMGNAQTANSINMTNGSKLNLNNGAALTCGSIELSGGSIIVVRNGNGGQILNSTITVNGTGYISGSMNGNASKVQGTIKGSGVLGLVKDTDYSNAWNVQALIKDEDTTAGKTLEVKIAGGKLNNGQMVASGDNKVTLSGANTYSGGTEIIGGTVTAANATALGTGKVTMKGGTLQQSADLTVSSMEYQGGTVNNNGKALTVNETLTVKSNMEIVGAGATSIGTLELALGLSQDTAAVTTSGALTLGTITLNLTDYAAGNYTLVSATGDGSIIWNDAVSYTGTLGKGLEASVDYGSDNKTLQLTISEMVTPGESLITTTVVEKNGDAFLYSLDGTTLTLTVEKSLAGLAEGGIVELDLISDEMKAAILASLTNPETGKVTEMVTLKLTDGNTDNDIIAGEDAIVGFFNEKNEGYFGENVGNGVQYNVNLIPEPTTATLSLLALMGLAARRRRQK